MIQSVVFRSVPVSPPDCPLELIDRLARLMLLYIPPTVGSLTHSFIAKMRELYQLLQDLSITMAMLYYLATVSWLVSANKQKLSLRLPWSVVAIT